MKHVMSHKEHEIHATAELLMKEALNNPFFKEFKSLGERHESSFEETRRRIEAKRKEMSLTHPSLRMRSK